jgi:uncharacterized protein with LGFP repeats
VSQRFTGGTVTWSPATGAQVVRGEILRAYDALRGPAGPLGFPTAPVTTSGAAEVQRFSSGAIWRTATGGAHAVRGGIAAGWQAAGGLGGPLGAPVGDETAAGAGAFQRFAGGAVYWSPATAAQVVRGDVLRAYDAARGPLGPLGYPIGAERASGSAWVQRFSSGAIWRTTAGGAHPVRGAIGVVWEAGGGITGPLGAPRSGEAPAGTGVAQRFAGGTLYWSATTGVRRTTDAILAAHVAAGGAAGALGDPLGDVYTWNGARRVDFAHGRIVERNGVAEVTVG